MSYQLEDSGSRFLVHDEQNCDSAEQLTHTVGTIRLISTNDLTKPVAPPAAAASGWLDLGATHAIVYTSGTMGRAQRCPPHVWQSLVARDRVRLQPGHLTPAPWDNEALPGVAAMAAERASYQDRIVRDPEIMVGKPVVKGTRIPVERVLDQLAYKPDLGELFAMFPELRVEDVRACLSYARAAVADKRRRPPLDRERAGASA